MKKVYGVDTITWKLVFRRLPIMTDGVTKENCIDNDNGYSAMSCLPYSFAFSLFLSAFSKIIGQLSLPLSIQLRSDASSEIEFHEVIACFCVGSYETKLDVRFCNLWLPF